jgi:uroporphyrinogen III methyltransferase/synthase
VVSGDAWPYRGFGGPPAAKGTVHLVGAGPGDVGLLTLRAAALLSTCDVVAYDRLAPAAALDLLPDHAERVCVGKRSGEAEMSRAAVDELLRSRAQAGAAVVRLKGGDPFVFGRGGEEAEACVAAGIPVEIVHGISAPVAVPGAAGIPVTHRTVSAGFAVVTGHEDPTKPGRQIDLAKVAAFPGTLLFLMAVHNLADLVAGLRRHGRGGDTPVALVQWGTTSSQRSVTGTFDTIVDDVGAAGIGSPSVVVVGDVVRLQPDIPSRELRPLHGVRVAVPRTLDRPSRLVAHLRHEGADVIEIQLARTEPGDVDGVREVARRILYGDLASVAATSTLAVALLRDALGSHGSDARGLAGVEVLAVGRSVAAAFRELLAVEPDRTMATADELPATGLVVLSRLGEQLDMPHVVASRAVAIEVDEARLRTVRDADLVAVGSSTVVPLLDGRVDADALHVSMGPVTTAALREAGRTVGSEASEPTVAGMLRAVGSVAGSIARSAATGAR